MSQLEGDSNQSEIKQADVKVVNIKAKKITDGTWWIDEEYPENEKIIEETKIGVAKIIVTKTSKLINTYCYYVEGNVSKEKEKTILDLSEWMLPERKTIVQFNRVEQIKKDEKIENIVFKENYTEWVIYKLRKIQKFQQDYNDILRTQSLFNEIYNQLDKIN